MPSMFEEEYQQDVAEHEQKVSLSRLQAFYGELEAIPLLRVMINEEFKGQIALFSAFGADSILLLSMVAEVNPDTPVLFLETGKHFQETLEYVQEVKEFLGLTNIKMLRPDPKLLLNIDPEGDLWQSQPNRCCWMRKIEPLAREMEESQYEALVTGRKRYQTKERAQMQTIELHDDNRFRINPLAHWTKEEIHAEEKRRNLPRHPLVAKGFPSIGCEPCTRAVKPGEDERSGRWAHTIDLYGKQKAECGIHTHDGPKPEDKADWSV